MIAIINAFFFLFIRLLIINWRQLITDLKENAQYRSTKRTDIESYYRDIRIRKLGKNNKKAVGSIIVNEAK